MSGNGFNPYSDPVARQLHEANNQLRAVNQQLWEAHQPPEVRAALQEQRAGRARGIVWGVRLVLALAGAWLVLSLVFGRAGQRLWGGLLSFAFDALGALLVVGFFVWVGGAVWRAARGVRTPAGRGGDRR